MRLFFCLAATALTGLPEVAFAQQQLQYRYDVHGRLVRVARPFSFSSSGYLTTYLYDDADNRTQRVVTIGTVAAVQLEPLRVPPVRLARLSEPVGSGSLGTLAAADRGPLACRSAADPLLTDDC